MKPHEYVYPTTREISRPVTIPECDTFGDGLHLNYLGGYCIVAYAKSLAKEKPQSLIPISNVVSLEDYRNGNTPEAA